VSDRNMKIETKKELSHVSPAKMISWFVGYLIVWPGRDTGNCCEEGNVFEFGDSVNCEHQAVKQ